MFRQTPLLLAAAASAFVLAPGARGADPAPLRVTEVAYTRAEESAPAFAIENDFYRATLVPAMGGRILDWVDKKTGTALVYDNGYGGLLDDHGARIKLPYAVEWIRRDAGEAVVALSRKEGDVLYKKTVSFHASRPTIAVDYHLENHGQVPQRLLFRNVVRPGGTDFAGGELYCYSRTNGLKRSDNMPRTDDQADPWCALVNGPKRIAVANAFEGDILARLYSWNGSKVAPTYEFMFPQLEAGRQMDARYTWTFAHGLNALDYAHRTFVAQVEGGVTGGVLTATLQLAGTWAPMPDLTVSATVLGADRSVIGTLPPRPLPVTALDTVASLDLSIPAAAPGDYAILLLALSSATMGREPIVVEKPFPAGGDPKRLAGYTRPVRWLGEHVEQAPIPGWKKEIAYVIQPDAADRARGYMIFDEIGPLAGRTVTNVAFDVAQNEPEAFPLHLHALAVTGTVTIAVETPKGMTLETFIPENVPETLWGRTLDGLKLVPGAAFPVQPGDDRLLYFRLKVTDLPPGVHTGRLTFTVPGAEPSVVPVSVTVFPVRFPRHPFMVFDVNNVANYLCSRQIKGTDYAWDGERATNYLSDMAAHGVAGQTINGINAPNAHYWYGKVRVRESGLSLPAAIAADPARFRDRLDLPALDFSEWDWFVDRLLEHGMTHVRWPMGGCGEGFMQGHRELTTLIYGHAFPAGDARQMVVMEWYVREVARYLKDRGITRVRGTIDDEIPSEELAWWVQHAYRSLQMGLEPGVTQSAETMASDLRVNLVAPFMKHWIIGTLHKPTLDKRRAQGIIKPEHWVSTYHSSANHWQPYAQMRGHCGLNPAFFDLDACWIQTYYRWNQSEAVIYPGPTGPVSSAAWEGARDGLDDGNFLLLARAMIRGLPDPADRARYGARLDALVGTNETSLVRFEDKLTDVGPVTQMARHDTALFREAKSRLLRLIVELADKAPVQRAAADFGLHPLIRDGVAVLAIPKGMAASEKAIRFLEDAANGLALERPEPAAVDGAKPGPVLFAGSLRELRERLPALAAHPDLADLGDAYPKPGQYVVRFVGSGRAPASMLVLAGDEAGLDKGLAALSNMVTQPRDLYSHWLPRRPE